MDNSILRSVIKFVFASTIVVVFSATSFAVGFGTSYMLTSNGTIPGLSATAPTPAPPSPATEQALPTLSPTPVPIPTPQSEDEKAFQVFWEVWDLVQQNFYGDLPDMQQVTYAAIHGMLSTLNDDHTAFIEPDVASVIQEDATGEFEGIGAFVGLDDDGKVKIVGVFEDGPAEKAGLQANDRVLEVDGVSVIGKTL